MDAVLYIHGKEGSAAESEHYKPLFPECDVIGLDYNLLTSSETEQAEIEIKAAVKCLQSDYEKIILIANSIGAFISMNADIEDMVDTAYFIPIRQEDSDLYRSGMNCRKPERAENRLTSQKYNDIICL